MRSDSDYVLSSLNSNVLESLSNECVTILSQVKNTTSIECPRRDHSIPIQLADTFMTENEEIEGEINVNEVLSDDDVNTSEDILSISDIENFTLTTGNDSYESNLLTEINDEENNKLIYCR